MLGEIQWFGFFYLNSAGFVPEAVICTQYVSRRLREEPQNRDLSKVKVYINPLLPLLTGPVHKICKARANPVYNFRI